MDLLKKTAIFGVLFSVAAMSAILYVTASKVIVIADVAQDEVADNKNTADMTTVGTTIANNELLFEENNNTGYLCIPLPAECKAEDVMIENHYMDRELWVGITQSEQEYNEKKLSGNRERIIGGNYEYDGSIMWLKFSMDGIYEYRSILENSNLYIEFATPREMYEKIVVIDPACGGEDTGNTNNDLMEKEITLQIAKKLKEKLDATDIKAYYTRMEDNNPTEEERIMLANGTKADLYIRIQANASEDKMDYGTEAVYNEEFFIPGFGSVELADILEKAVVTSIKGKARGLVAAGEKDYAIKQATIPAVAISVGYLSNAQEAIILGREDYIEKIAEGIYQAIMEAYKANSQ